VISGSESMKTFTITVTLAPPAKVSLTITVPSQVSVSVDGTAWPAGIVQAGLPPGSHTISVPLMVDTSPGVRLWFDSWKDGYPSPARTLNLQADSSFEAVYVTEYNLTLSTPYGDAVGAGWYDSGSSAQISSPASEPMSGVLGDLGGKWVFQGCYEGQTLVSPSSSTTIAMYTPHSLTAHWTADYLTPASWILPLIVVAIAALLIIYKWPTKRKS
jgi:hypothetical protein